MEKEKIVIEEPIDVAGVTIVPVTKVSLVYRQGQGSLLYFGDKQLDSVILISSSGKKAFRLTGEEISLDQLAIEAPGIKEALAGIESTSSPSH